MNLAPAPAAYDKNDQDRMRRTVSDADNQSVKFNSVLTSFKMRDTATGTIKTVVITSGAFVIT